MLATTWAEPESDVGLGKPLEVIIVAFCEHEYEMATVPPGSMIFGEQDICAVALPAFCGEHAFPAQPYGHVCDSWSAQVFE